ncbi:MAG: histidine kinase [Haliscomenobacter sp.]|uniref:sensor histidine kinase n=1 Tax=Haliscomenobacter sp. TaxID=2717303 RepID=UPI0029A20491|nr:histidine kinase [Haliscomenobacter sp.]MDX2070591.1 histidine kinase [Haliscomenobacter sp.]
MPQSPKSQTTRLILINKVLPWFLVGAVVVYLIWRFLQVYIVNLGGEMEGIGRLLRYFGGILLELLLVWGLALLNFRFIFLRFATADSRFKNWYWAWIGMFALLCFAWLEWRTDYEPEFADENVLSTILLTSFVVAYAYSADYFRTKRAQLALLKDKTMAELNVLKAQIKPHFLFNTMNVLYNSAQKHEDETTAKLIFELSQLLRFSIQEAAEEFTSLENELAFLERYIQFQRLRLPQTNKLDIQIDINKQGEGAKIAPLLMIPFMENAFQYGISLNEACFVHLKLNVEGQNLVLLLRNSIAPNPEARSGLGTGIRNSRERLQLLYPQRHQLRIKESDNTFEVTLKIDL